MAASTTNWRIPPVAWAPIAIAVTAEATSNALRAYGLGTHLEAFTIRLWSYDVSVAGAVLVMAAVAVSLSQARAAWVALLPGMVRHRIVAGLIASLLLAVSITAMASTILEAQRAKTTDEDNTRSKYDRAQSAYEAANTELKALVEAGVRTVAEIKADVDAARVPPKILDFTNDCTSFQKDLAQFRKACGPLLQLRSQLAGAQRKSELEATVRTLKAEADGLKAPKQANASEAGISEAWGWIMGFAVVFVATFGPVIFATPEASEVLADGPEGTEPIDRGGPGVEARVPNLPKGGEPVAPGLQPPPKPADRSKRPKRSFTLDEIRTDLMVRNATGRAFNSQREAADHYGYSESRYSELSKSWEAEGLIPKRQMVGKSKRLTMA
ncbi:conserved membrane protein of unknown function [Hyphomicrobium sp. 1Nfss2.1]|uniref:hypothetical protein n=1 Tax=Hyphomicrobium sp. 1Nfss2.1 TaxID=3413936 RepID=UPI003C7B7A55